MIPFRKPLLRTLKTTMACSMYLIPSQESVLLQGPGSIKKLPALIKAQGIQKPLIVTGSHPNGEEPTWKPVCRIQCNGYVLRGI